MAFLPALLERENTGRTIFSPDYSCSQMAISRERDIQRELVKRAWDNLEGFDVDVMIQNTQEWTSSNRKLVSLVYVWVIVENFKALYYSKLQEQVH